MMQIPNLPNYNYAQVPQPNYNAVKIDVHNPMVNVPAQVPVQQQVPQYATPTMPYYNYPQAQLYSYPQAPVQPYYMPPVITTPETQAPQLPPAAPQAPVMVPPTVAEAPKAAEVPTVPAPQVVPAPVVTQPQEAPKAEEAKQPEAPAEAPKAADAAGKPVDVVPPAPVTPQVDLNSFIAKLTNPDYDVQASGMEEIANMVNEDPKKATELLDSKIVDALTNIITADTSSLQGPSKEQVAARQKLASNQQLTEDEKKLATTISPLEQAERNKSYAMFTSAIMQKLYADEVQKLTNSTVPLTELPGAVTIVEQLKNNANPMVRTSAIEALSYIQNPAYQKDLNTIFTIAQKDQDKGVQEAATLALEKLNAMAPAEAPKADAAAEAPKAETAAEAPKADATAEAPKTEEAKQPEAPQSEAKTVEMKAPEKEETKQAA